MDDLLARGDDRLGLLPAQHHLRDLGGVREVHEACFLDHHAGLAQPRLQLVHERSGDDIGRTKKRGAGRLARRIVLVVGERRGEVAHRGLALDLDEVLVVVDLERCPRGVVDVPDDDGGDLDRVAALVVHLQALAGTRLVPR